MENITTKISNIETLMDVLDDDDCKLFNKECKYKFKKIERILSEIEDILNEYNFCEDKCNQKEIDNKKNTLIMNNLFVFYWYLKDRVDSSTPKASLEFPYN